MFGFFGGTIVNRLGVRLALSFGGIGYCIYSISLLVSVHKYVPGFNIFAGAFLGVCAGLLWTAQGTIMMSCPPEQSKGRYFAWFWGIFNVGACVGSLVSVAVLCCALACGYCAVPTLYCYSPEANFFVYLHYRSLSERTLTLRPTSPSMMVPTLASLCSCSPAPAWACSFVMPTRSSVRMVPASF